MCGNQIEFDNRVFYAFPTPYQLSKLSVEQLIECGAGYRAQYIKETAECIKNGFDIDGIFSMEYKDAKKYGFGEGYIYTHAAPDIEQQFMPDELVDRKYL